MTGQGTLEHMRAKGDSITVYCPAGHGAAVDMGAAIAKFGPEFDLVDGRARFLDAFRCRRCGERASSLIRSPPSGPRVG